MSARSIAVVALGLAASLASTGCAGLEETWNYGPMVTQPLSDKSPPPTFEGASCKVPLHVAVKPFHSERRGGNYGEGGMLGWAFGGLLFSAPAGAVAEWTEEDMKRQSVMYRHSESRTWAHALYEELTHMGCFEEVAYDPLDESQYDLVFDADVVRHGRIMRFPLVPLPLFLGTGVAFGLMKADRMIEMDVQATSWSGKPALDYGFQAACMRGEGCTPWSATSEITIALHDGYGEMLSRLGDYLSSRTPAYWAMVHERRVDQQRALLDPDLPALGAALRDAKDDASRAALEAERDRRVERLDAMLEEDRRVEHEWADLSLAVFQHKVDQVNEEIDSAFTQRMIAAAVAGASVGVASGLSIAHGGSAPNPMAVQSEVQQRMASVLDSEKKVLAFVDGLKAALGLNLSPGDPLAGKVDRFGEALEMRALRRASELALYQASRKAPGDVLLAARAPGVKAKANKKGK